ncbi:MAG: L-idonate 5-dehydrogenase [Saprospiraceae bacterium]|nr:L-idonate 5-dehydrogenase [Saprospiraceae bacterium]MBK6479713.1 L-idonate 5-dehydrogenase [Saprospiraceae bacterium]MBK7607990.1 L-idonate 5-dehydrogenase [Saprospiraceae bacterium]MBK9932449.1 L-idonate 5-dehydrogenase [Saprospiraceae bacterium]MBP7923636.1 L-idonate 5-dehydrogenase [Saprospiraceae bacterium]
MDNSMNAAVLHGAKDLRLEKFNHPDLLPGMVLLRVKRVGICGSDLHYFEDGYCGSFTPTRPFILGHELTAEVADANGASSLRTGDRVTVNPARACGYCDYCKGGRGNLCRHTVMLGSGSTNPPTNGAMAEYLTVRADQCHLLPDGMDDGHGAMIEPLAVALHAVKRPMTVAGKRVLVTGGGTIGLLTAITAKAFGAVPVVVSDIVQERRTFASKCKIDYTLDPTDPQIESKVKEMTGDGFDVIFEASGARPALRQAFDLVRPGGTIVQIGTLGTIDVPLPANMVMVKEIQFLGSFRYGNVFDEAIRLVMSGRIDLNPFITGVLPLNDVNQAMHLAADKVTSLKVQLQV